MFLSTSGRSSWWILSLNIWHVQKDMGSVHECSVQHIMRVVSQCQSCKHRTSGIIEVGLDFNRHWLLHRGTPVSMPLIWCQNLVITGSWSQTIWCWHILIQKLVSYETTTTTILSPLGTTNCAISVLICEAASSNLWLENSTLSIQ